jgi:hypothetical protein
MKLSPELRERLTAKKPEWYYGYQSKPKEEPKLFLMSDPNIAAKWVVVYGWIVLSKNQGTKLLRGDVVYRGPDASRNEINPVEMRDECSYVTEYFKDRTVVEL